MHTSLRDLEDDGTLDSMTITLPCQHVFTVETLDGVTHLGDFYEKDQTGKWIKAIIPEASGELRTRPVCPTCRGSITSLRYGRVCKSSNIAIMQHNIASSLSRRLATAEKKLAASRTGLNASIASAVKGCIPVLSATDISPAAHREIRDKLDLTLIKEVDRPTPVDVLRNLDEFHAYTQKDAELWRKAVGGILTSYQNARQIACDRDPSVQAYEASLAALYQDELSQFGSDLSRGAPQDVEQRALRLARMRIGQPPPRASLRFVVEAFWVTTEILMLLGLATREASNEVQGRDSNTENSSYWTKLAEFFFKRGIEDAEVALSLAESSESWNKVVKCQVILLRALYESAAHECQSTVDTGGISDPNTRALLVQMCENGIETVQRYQSTVPRGYLQRWNNEERTMRLEWINTNFTQPSTVILDSWKQLKRSAESGTWYSEVTNEERAAIMKAMMEGSGRESGLSHTGHFYQCPNGHPYAIGECGGAMQASTCPECGARIGGGSHQITAGNTHATDFVNLARTQGAQESPWEWGPNGRRR
ncbi:hypothetical protein BDV93DRAFT_526047 [Ceratobasidium sp. AG-I]|nr:hypothetical protein BDV93DRAFT_526047 [Ceratobasidium sp. AG-I]